MALCLPSGGTGVRAPVHANLSAGGRVHIAYRSSMTNDSERLLLGTPYLTQGDAISEARFAKVRERAVDVRERALLAQARIFKEATALLGPYMIAVRSDLVAESNRIEGYEWNTHQIRELVRINKELLDGPHGSFMAALRGDERTYQALGLYRAHMIADEWASTNNRPREYDIRGLHQLITGNVHFAGQYKSVSNKIAGSAHKTTEPWDVPKAMNELCEWWTNPFTDPALDATVIHAWLTHIHPFEDGNGRMARLLANLALTQSGYPPFLIRSEADRGQYYDALSASDDGDILPLYDLVVKILRRTVRTMSSPDYVREVVRDRLLTSVRDEWAIWLELPRRFVVALTEALNAYGWKLQVQGYLDVSSFSLLANRDLDGNSWFVKIFDSDGQPAWLLWFGFNSEVLIDLIGEKEAGYPSVMLSIRDSDPYSVHPYKWVTGYQSDLPDEIVFRPLERRPVIMRWNYNIEEMTTANAASLLAQALTHS